MKTETQKRIHALAERLDYTEVDFDGLLAACHTDGIMVTEDELFELSETDPLVSMFLDIRG